MSAGRLRYHQPGAKTLLGKTYAEAEIGLVKAIVNAKAKVLILAAVLLGIATLFALAGITALSLGVVLALAGLIGPLAAGFVGVLLKRRERGGRA